MATFILVDEKEYEGLQRDSDVLWALYAAGVDNWTGYEEAINILEEESNNEGEVTNAD